MFEEVPRARRGLAGLTARRVVLGPFVIGGGMLLAAVGGSVAVAATVITASSIHANDVPPRPAAPHPAVAASTGHHTAAAARHQPVVAAPTVRSTSSLPATSPVPSVSRPASVPPAVVPSPTGPVSSTAPSAKSTLPTGSPSASSSGPVGNALIYLTGYDSTTQRVLFEFAVVDHGSGPNGSDVYRVESTRGYSATLAADLTVTSGGQLCPPAGNRCSTDQLIAAAGAGFFAIAAIDPAEQLHSIVEVDNVGTSFAPVSGPPATPSSSPTNP
jgi:hypothetical protein